MIDPIFDAFHKYNKLARRQLVKPLTCELCDEGRVVTMSDYDSDDLILWCPLCNTKTKPGQDMIDRVRAVVSEHFDV
jgi:hypothetical protein